MATSLRYGGDSKALRIHAKEKLPINSDTLLQVHRELDTRVGAPSYFCALLRHFYPDLCFSLNFSASLGVGLKYDKREKLCYIVRGKKSFPVTTNGHFIFNIKGHCDMRSKGAAELSWAILNFQKEQDVRLKIGYEVPYFHIRKNNWTFNANGNGRWNVRFDL
ncbi:hypothetical protein UlMin_037882 [Ulmus minor]